MDEPILYIIDGTNYNFNDFLKDANSGISEYISSLKRGDKDDDYFYKAYDDLMEGIKNKTITFIGGRLHDSLGRYRNGEIRNLKGELIKSNKKSKDYYGLIANYLDNKARAQSEYISPDKKKKEKLTDDIIRQKLYNLISNNGVLGYDALSSLDEEGKYTNLFKKINSGLTGFNFDNEFKDYDYNNILKNKWIGNEGIIKSAINAMSDGNYDTSDLYALKNLYGDYYDKIFTKPTTSQDNISYLLQFEQYLNNNNYNILINDPDIDLTSAQPLGDYIKNQFVSSIQGQDFNTVVSKIFALDKDDNFKNSFLLTAINLFGNKFIKLSDNEMYYPVPNDDNTVWSIKTNSSGKVYLSKKRMIDIPEFLDQIINEWATLNNLSFLNSNKWYSKYFVPTLKKGGILKYLKGKDIQLLTSFTNPKEAITYNLDNNEWFMLDNNDDKLSIIPAFDPTDKIVPRNNYYDPIKGGGIIESNEDYQNIWIQNLLKNKELAEKYAKFYKDKVGDKSNSYETWFKENDLFDHDAFKKTKVFSDRINGIGHAFQKGITYKIGDNYYREIPKGYIETSYDLSNPFYTIINLLKSPDHNAPIGPPEDDTDYNSSDVYKRKEELKKEKLNNKYNEKSLESIIAMGRLYNSLRTNKKNYKTLRDSLHPSLSNPFEIYSPVTGDYAKLKNNYELAANFRREGNNAKSSDNDSNNAFYLDMNRQASKLENEGNYSDNKEIIRSMEKANNNNSNNIKLRSNIANNDIKELNNYSSNLGLLKSAKRMQDWKAIDNYLTELLQNARDKYNNNLELSRNINLLKKINEITLEYQSYRNPKLSEITNWVKNNPGKSITEAPTYLEFKNYDSNLLNILQDKILEAKANIYGIPYNYPTRSFNEIS